MLLDIGNRLGNAGERISRAVILLHKKALHACLGGMRKYVLKINNPISHLREFPGWGIIHVL